MTKRRILHTLLLLTAATLPLAAQADESPDSDDPPPSSLNELRQPQDPQLLQEFLPQEALGFERLVAETLTFEGMPAAQARYRGGEAAARIRILHLYGEAGDRYLLNLRRDAQEREAERSSIGEFIAYFFEAEGSARMVLLVGGRYLVESQVKGSGATSRLAQRALEDVDIERLRTLEP